MIIRSTLVASGLALAVAGSALAQTVVPGNPGNSNPTGTQLRPDSQAPNTTGVNPNNPSMAPGMTGGTTGSVTPAPGAAMDALFTGSVGQNHWRASDMIDEPVYNSANERIGEINEIVLDQDGRVVAAIVGVGGFLGIGERDVAVNFQSIRMNRDTNGAVRLVVDIDRNRLQNAPAFTRPSTWGRS
jgi:sporulation protein YlmC with PRC-barrel domain